MKGKPVSESIREYIKEEVKQLDIKPNLTVIKVGNDPASETYVNNKIKACFDVGIESTLVQLPEDSKARMAVKEIFTKLNIFYLRPSK